MHPRRLLWQLYPSYLLITLASLIAAGLFAAITLRDYHRGRTEASLEATALALEDSIGARLARGAVPEVDALCKELGQKAGIRVTVVGPTGEVLGDSLKDPAAMDNHADREEIRDALRRGRGTATRYSYTLKQNMLYVAVPLQSEGKTLGVLRTAMAARDVEQVFAALRRRLALAGLGIAVVAATVSLLVARRISRPFEEIQHGAERFARGELDHKLPIPPFHEAAALAETMNQMAAQLDARIHDALRQRNEREAILSSMVEGVLAIDLGEHLISFNQAAARLLGIDPEKAQGRTLQEAVRNRELQRLVAEVLVRQQPVASELAVVSRDDGANLQLHAQGTVLHDSQNRPIGAMVVLHDLTRIKKLESVRRDFVANVSHELKTPVTSIKGFVETLLDGAMNDPADADRFLRIVASQADRLNSIIEDLLTLSRLEQGAENEIALGPGRIGPVLAAAADVCLLKAKDKQVEVAIACDEDLSAPINAVLLEQAVVNLVDNAIKYSPKGQMVRVEALGEADEVVIRVTDRGCGIPREHLARIFERFYRVDRARSRELGGTGLGLAIVKHIAQVHGGHTSVKSTVGEGSVFSIRLPAHAADASNSTPGAS